MSRLERLLRPKSIAVIGGGAFGANVVQQCLKMGFSGDIWPVHPKKDEVEGVKAYRTVADLPGAPDATFIGVNRNLTIEMVKALRERGAGAAICFASGFRETGHYDPEGEALQKALIEAAGSMPILGPNCYGLINYADGALLWPDQHGGQRLAPGARGAAIITQSSNIACNLTMQKRGLPVAFLMTAGNQAQTGLSEMALGLIEDERVSCLGLHIEGFDSAAGFERLAARARELKKPIVAMKVGRSEQARAGAVSHTASLAGSDTASDAFLRRLGIARVNSIPSFLETLKLLHAGGPLTGYALSSMSCSGGEASVMADSAEGRRIFFPALAEEHRAQVKSTLGPLVAVANPLDYHTFIWNNEPAMTATFTAMVSGGFDLNMLVLDFPRTDRCSDADWWSAVRAFDAALKASGARGAIVASMLENLPEEHAAELFRRGIVPLHGIVEAMDAAEAAGFIGEAWQRPFPSPLEGAVPAKRAEGVAADGFTPPFALPGHLPLKGGDGAPSSGEIGSSSLAASPSTLTVGETSSDGVISPLEGEMPGRAEGGAPSVTSAIGAAPAASVISPLEGEMPGRAEGGASEGTSYAPSTAAATPPGPSGHPPLKGEGNLDEASAKSLLAKAGVSVPAGRRATSIEEAAAAAEAIGYPVALKALGVAHKSEAGAVKLNLRDAESSAESGGGIAAARNRYLCRAYGPGRSCGTHCRLHQRSAVRADHDAGVRRRAGGTAEGFGHPAVAGLP